MSLHKVRHRFNPEKDVILKAWKDEDIGLLAGIYSYNGGAPKFQVGPRMSWRKNAQGELYPVTLRMGRMHKEDLLWLRTIIDDVLATFDELKDVRFVEGEYSMGVTRDSNENDLSSLYELAKADTEERERCQENPSTSI